MANETCFSFSVDPGTYRIISGVNLDDEDFLDLWRLACPAIDCDDTTELWIPFRPGCELISLTATCNPLVVTTPGRYRLIQRLGERNDFTWLDVLAVTQEHPELNAINAEVKHKVFNEVDKRMKKS